MSIIEEYIRAEMLLDQVATLTGLDMSCIQRYVNKTTGPITYDDV